MSEPLRNRDQKAPCELFSDDMRPNRALSSDRVSRRLLLVAGCFAVAFGVTAGRTAYLSTDPEVVAQFFKTSSATSRLASHRPARPATDAKRPEITDRNGQLLAADLPSQSLMVDTGRLRDPHGMAQKLAIVLGRDNTVELVGRLSGRTGHIRLARRLTPTQVQAIYEIGDPALWLENSVTRTYPAGPLGAHVVGFVNADRQAQMGLEKGFDTGRAVPAENVIRSTIDMRVQHVVRRTLLATQEKFSARAAVGIVLNAQNGEVLSMVSLPDFDPNQPGGATGEAQLNRATFGRYEMGSTFKAFTAAMAIEQGGMRLTDRVDASAPIRVARFRIRDHHAKNRVMSVAEVFQYSSNIGAAKMAVSLGPAAQRNFLGKLGLLERPDLQIPETIRPGQPRRWGELETMTISYGHGLSVSPLQLTAAMAAMVNGGTYYQPTFLTHEEGAQPAGTQVIKRRTSDQIRKLFRLVVAEGTGRKAAAPGYMVGGKTGTAEIATKTGYDRKRMVTSFVAAFPMQDPKIITLVLLDTPKGIKETFGYATAGWTAAPAIAEIIPQIAPMLGISPVREDRADLVDKLAIPAAAFLKKGRKNGATF